MHEGIRVIRNLPWEKIKLIKCLYCMDTAQCRICRGVGKLPTKSGGSIKAVDCWNCHGLGVCPMCNQEDEESA
jgi:hypothetical protein